MAMVGRKLRTKLSHPIRAIFARLFGEARGNAIIPTALAMPVLIGFIGLAVDVSAWEMAQRQQQGAVDQAAFSAATAALKGASVDQATVEAKAVLASLGFVGGAGSVTVTVHNPPSTGNYTANTNAWEVRVSKPSSKFFSGIFMQSDAPVLMSRAVALKGTLAVAGADTSTPGAGCILALDPTSANTAEITNNGAVSNSGCAVYAKSNANGSSGTQKAVQCYNNCAVAAKIFTRGGVRNNGAMTGAISTGYDPFANGTSTTDPYVDPYAISPPVVSGMPCMSGTRLLTVSANMTINPGRYCGGIMVGSGKVLTMNPGTYYVEGMFGTASASTVTGTGVTIVTLGNYCLGITNSTCEHPDEGLMGNLNITAPTSGTYAGVAMHLAGAAYRSNQFANGSWINVQGVIYAPTQKLSFNNNSWFNSALCTQIVSYRVTINNNSNMANNCAGTGMKTIGDTTMTTAATPGAITRLVE